MSSTVRGVAIEKALSPQVRFFGGVKEVGITLPEGAGEGVAFDEFREVFSLPQQKTQAIGKQTTELNLSPKG